MTFLFQKIAPSDTEFIDQIADWYHREWQIEREITYQRLRSLPESGIPFHLIMFVDGKPIATGGIHHDVRLIKIDSRFKKYDPWLALVYTVPEFRKKGYGEMLCKKLESMSLEMGLNEIFLYTTTAESLYRKIGWTLIERIDYMGCECAVMKKSLLTGMND
jgi:GNAT superfamily N-acetyltransferase